jgi:hypothetical protein
VTTNANCYRYYGFVVTSKVICTAADPNQSICNVIKKKLPIELHRGNADVLVFRVTAAARWC